MVNHTRKRKNRSTHKKHRISINNVKMRKSSKTSHNKRRIRSNKSRKVRNSNRIISMFPRNAQSLLMRLGKIYKGGSYDYSKLVVDKATAIKSRDSWKQAMESHSIDLLEYERVFSEWKRTKYETHEPIGEIDRDIDRTPTPSDVIKPSFGKSIKSILYAMYDNNPDVKYVQGMNFYVSFLLYFVSLANMNEGESISTINSFADYESEAYSYFYAMFQIKQLRLQELYSEMQNISLYSKIINQYTQKNFPEIYKLLQENIIDDDEVIALYYYSWWTTLFADKIEWKLLGDIWTVFMKEGFVSVIRAVQEYFAVLKPMILSDNIDDTMALNKYMNHKITLAGDFHIPISDNFKTDIQQKWKTIDNATFKVAKDAVINDKPNPFIHSSNGTVVTRNPLAGLSDSNTSDASSIQDWGSTSEKESTSKISKSTSVIAGTLITGAIAAAPFLLL